MRWLEWYSPRSAPHTRLVGTIAETDQRVFVHAQPLFDVARTEPVSRLAGLLRMPTQVVAD